MNDELTSVASARVAKGDFIVWQLPSQIDTIMNSYVFLMKDGKVCVMDGGSRAETEYLRHFLALLGNRVEAWFMSHPHPDHVEALNEILKDPLGLTIKTVYHSELSEKFHTQYETIYSDATAEFYRNLRQFDCEIVDLQEPGDIITVSQTRFQILGVKNEEITVNPYNNQSMVIKVWDECKSILFLADLGKEGGEKLYKSTFRDQLNCDYLQLAHHGQSGVSKDFYRSIHFKACLWPTPTWLYNNDNGGGYNTHTWETVEIRQLMDELGISEHYRSFEGLARIE
jgi:beta-lactamase superfamily II metal-dependent hydrolase